MESESTGHRLVENLEREGYTTLLVYGVKLTGADPQTEHPRFAFRCFFPTPLLKTLAAVPGLLEPLLREIAVMKEMATKPPDDQDRKGIDVEFGNL